MWVKTHDNALVNLDTVSFIEMQDAPKEKGISIWARGSHWSSILGTFPSKQAAESAMKTLFIRLRDGFEAIEL